MGAQEEHTRRMAGLAAATQTEAASAKLAAKQSRQLSATESAEIDQTVTFQIVESKHFEYSQLAASVHTKYGQNPIYLTKELTYKFYKEQRVLDSFDIISTAANEVFQLITLATSIKFFSTELNDLANQKSTIENSISHSDADWIKLLDNRISTIGREKNIILQQLPSFIQQKLAPAINATNNLSITESVSHQISAIDRLAKENQDSAGSYKQVNRKITAPLSKPELDSLHNLVNGQSNKSIGPAWADYHLSLLHSESARHLAEASQPFKLIQPRIDEASTLLTQKRAEAEIRRVTEEATRQLAQQLADAAAQEFAQRQAEDASRMLAQQQAEEAAREIERQIAEAAAQKLAKQHAAEEAVVKAERAKEESISRAHIALKSMIAAPSLTPATEGAVNALGKALTKIAAKVAARKLIATIAKNRLALLMAYSPNLGNSEMAQSVVSKHIDRLDLPEELDLDYIASVKGTVDVARRLVLDATNPDSPAAWVVADGVRLGSKVRVRQFTYDSQSNTYQFTRDGETVPTFIWTPIVRPADSSTSSPAELPLLPVNLGFPAVDTAPEIETYPGVFRDDPDDYILTSPPGYDLPNTYVVFRDPRTIPGITEGYGAAVTGTWLGESARSNGALIPSQVADLLRGQRFSDFDRLRAAIWTAVANDPELSKQFIGVNIAHMKLGKAPFALQDDQVGDRKKFEIHHKQWIVNGGSVYDMDNLVILSPKKHIETHKLDKKP